MPARLSLTKAQRDALLVLPDTEEAFIRHYSLNGEDVETSAAIARRRRGSRSRCSFACFDIPAASCARARSCLSACWPSLPIRFVCRPTRSPASRAGSKLDTSEGTALPPEEHQKSVPKVAIGAELGVNVFRRGFFSESMKIN